MTANWQIHNENVSHKLAYYLAVSNIKPWNLKIKWIELKTFTFIEVNLAPKHTYVGTVKLEIDHWDEFMEGKE